ncbi:MAG: hypothetical protein HYX42_01550 [Polaromonas sp.]|uniref:hypothetical protein n=1 Tax=Polaromonas sp. TaxID=1869339 RepID=UPI0025EF8F02|nr:hypothetical protein [Polaromonas sp.]MBI2724912.1 hypothetical protein [Polaromonas sp.]
METWKEIWGAFKGQLADRVGNPFAGAFLIAWVTLNFRLLVVLFWVEPYKEKFKYIDQELYPHIGYWALRGFILPVAFAYLYLLTYSWLTTWTVAHYRRMQSKASNEMRKAAGAALMTPEENERALQRIARAEAKWHQEQGDLRAELSRQSELNNALISELEALKTKAGNQTTPLTAEIENSAIEEGRRPRDPITGRFVDASQGAVVKTETASPQSKNDVLPNDLTPESFTAHFKLSKRHPALKGSLTDHIFSLATLRLLHTIVTVDSASEDDLASFHNTSHQHVRRMLQELQSMNLVWPSPSGKFSASAEGVVLLQAFTQEGVPLR